MASQHCVNVSGTVPPDHEFCEFIPVHAHTTVAELCQVCIDRCPALADTGVELVARADSSETPCVRQADETISSIWPEWTKALQVMYFGLWPLLDGKSTYPIPDDVKFGMALPAKYSLDTFIPKEEKLSPEEEMKKKAPKTA